MILADAEQKDLGLGCSNAFAQLSTASLAIAHVPVQVGLWGVGTLGCAGRTETIENAFGSLSPRHSSRHSLS